MSRFADTVSGTSEEKQNKAKLFTSENDTTATCAHPDTERVQRLYNEHLIVEIVTLNRALIAAREGNLKLLQASVCLIYLLACHFSLHD